MDRRTTIATLFPYTTLFRSEASCFVPRVLMYQIELKGNHFPPTLYPPEHLPRVPAVVIRSRLVPFKAVDVAFFDHKPKRGCALDRKSTRLNSSHANISYAVF